MSNDHGECVAASIMSANEADRTWDEAIAILRAELDRVKQFDMSDVSEGLHHAIAVLEGCPR